MKHTKWKQLLAAVCIVWMLPLSYIAVAAPEENAAEVQEEKPRVDSEGRPILLSGETGILVEQKSGLVLYESDSQKRMYPASTTKVMTCLLAVEAIERGEVALDEQITITAQMLEGLDIDGSNMALKEDEVLAFEHLLWGLMVPSGNDAAMAIAFRLAGSQEAFAEKMNARAAELGLKDTHFVNPHGLHDDNHYTTAADMAEIARVGMSYDIFRNIVDIAHIKIPPTNKTETERYYLNTNGLLSGMRYSGLVYKGATGIKTGRTDDAGNCLVSSAKRNGMELIGVLFNALDVTNSHQESARMLDYGFENYQLIRGVAKGELLGESKVRRARGKDTVTLAAAADIMVPVPKGTGKDALQIELQLPEKLYAPLEEAEEVAGVTLLYEGKVVGSGRLLTLTQVKRSFFWPVMALGEWLWSFALIRGIVYILLAILVVLAFFVLRAVFYELRRIYRKNMQQKRK